MKTKISFFLVVLAALFISCSSNKTKYSDEQKPYALPDKYENMSRPGLVYISHISNKFVTVFDLSTMESIGKVPCGNGSMCTYISVDGKRGYITNYNSGDLTVFDPKSNETIATVIAGSNPTFLLAINSGKDLLISHQSSEGIWVLNTSDNSITKSLKQCTGPLYYIEKENKVYQPQIFTSYLYIIDPASTEVVKKIETGGRPMEMAFTPDKGFGYLVNFDSNEVAKIDTKTDSIILKIKNVTGPRGIALSNDGKLLFVTNVAENTITVIDTESDAITKRIFGFQMPTSVGFSKDDKYAVVTNQSAGKISIVDIKSLTLIRSVEVAAEPIFLMVDNR